MPSESKEELCLSLAGSVTMADRRGADRWKWKNDELKKKGPGYRTIQLGGNRGYRTMVPG